MTRRKEHLDIKRLMLMGSILCVFLGTMGSISLAAFGLPAEQAAAGTLGESVKVYDPFSLQTITVPDISTAEDATSSQLEAVSSRVPIRIPYRPSVRSAFRPGSGF